MSVHCEVISASVHGVLVSQQQSSLDRFLYDMAHIFHISSIPHWTMFYVKTSIHVLALQSELHFLSILSIVTVVVIS